MYVLTFQWIQNVFYLQLDHDKLVTLVAAGNEIIGEHHIVKWPIAKILILFRPKDLNDSNAKSNLKWDFRNPKNKAEILLRYQHTPAVISSRSMLVYSQPRTRGMCSVLDFWPWWIMSPNFYMWESSVLFLHDFHT